MLDINVKNNLPLRQRFDAFIAANTNKKASGTDFRRKGSLGVGLIVTHTLMTKPQVFPLQPEDFLADAGTQVKNLSGSNINKILKKNGIDKSLGTEVGRTNRGAPQHMRVYIEFLNDVQANGLLDLDALLGFWLEKVREFFAAKPFELKLDPSLGLRAMVRHLMKQAAERQRQQQGFNFAGTLAQHLIGAKLDLVLGIDPARHHGANQNDVGGRHGDFLINDVCIHVTTAPGSPLMQKCKANLSHGLRPIIVTVYSRVQVAEALAEDVQIADRIDIFEIEQFIATNMFELSLFKPADRRVKVGEFVARYNELIDVHETDPSLRIHFLE
ncbi:DUF4928 family protein [Burkholderia cenocepacia]|uniref:DUF4928 family protein n=1 Tax=Burkholderia cenocepacia TaxID=95486 RepID=UPI00158A7ED3|nr:DUF4928 family protein [Burkholderia cenocepacia]